MRLSHNVQDKKTLRTNEEDINKVSDVATSQRQPLVRRAWAMPNKWTFRIPVIRELLEKYVNGKWLDPFAGEDSPARDCKPMEERK